MSDAIEGQPVSVQRVSSPDPIWPSHPEQDVILPIQFSRIFNRELRLERERLLMFAVLEDGITAYLTHARARTRRGREAFAEVNEWVSSPDRRRLFAFETICDVLAIDASCLRHALSERQGQQRRLRCRPTSTAARGSRSAQTRGVMEGARRVNGRA